MSDRTRVQWKKSIAWMVGSALVGVGGEVLAADVPKITFVDHVQPIFRQKCASCHNPDKKSGGLDVTNFGALMLGGSSGEVIDPSNSGASYLWMLVNHESQPKMPPNSDKLPAEMLAIISKWIDGGALETSGSKALASKKPKVDLKVTVSPTQRPAGPAPMPMRLSLAPVVRTKSTTAVTTLAVNPWSTLAAVPGQKQVLLYNTQTLDLLGVLPFPEGVPSVLKFSRNGQLLLAGGGHGSSAGKVIVWNVKTGDRVFEVGDELDTVLAADISADQSLIALGGPSRMLRVYSTADGKLVYETKKHTDWITSLSFSPDGVLLASGDRNGGLFVWEADTGREFHSLRGHTAMISGVSWRLDSNLVASSSEDGNVRLWEMENGSSVKNWVAHTGGSASVEFTRDGRLVTAGRDKTIKMWDQNGTAQRTFEAMGDIALASTFCNETNRALGADWTGAIRVWNAVDGAKLGELTTNPLTLEERLATATAGLAAVEAEAKAAIDAHAALQAAADKMKADMAAANAQVANMSKVVTDATANINNMKATLTTSQGALESAQKVVAAQEPVVVALNESLAKGAAATAKAPEDKEVAALVAQLKALHDARAATVAASKKSMEEKAVETAKLKEQLTALEKQLVDSTAALENAKKTVAALEPAIKPAEDKAVAAKAVHDASAAKLASSKAMIARWQAELDFAGKMKQLAEKKAAADAVVATAEQAAATMDKAKADLAAAQKNVPVIQQAINEANAAANVGKQTIATATAEQQTATASATSLEAVLPTIRDAHTKAAEAAAKSTNDKALAESGTILKGVLDRQIALINEAKAVVTAKATAIEQAKAAVAAAEKKAADNVVALNAINAKVIELTAAAKQAEDKHAAAKQAADQALQPVLVLQTEVQKLRETKL